MWKFSDGCDELLSYGIFLEKRIKLRDKLLGIWGNQDKILTEMKNNPSKTARNKITERNW